MQVVKLEGLSYLTQCAILRTAVETNNLQPRCKPICWWERNQHATYQCSFTASPSCQQHTMLVRTKEMLDQNNQLEGYEMDGAQLKRHSFGAESFELVHLIQLFIYRQSLKHSGYRDHRLPSRVGGLSIRYISYSILPRQQ